MYSSIVFRTCRISQFRSCLNKVNIQHPSATAICLKHSSTESKINSINVQTNDAEWKNIYIGTLGPRIRNLKIVSFMTSAVGLCIQPMVIQKAAEVGSSLAATIGVCTIAGFFTFITPILIHLVTRKYVTSIEYNEKNDEYNATTISLFLKPRKIQFKPFEVRLPLTQKLTVTFYAKEFPLFVDPQAFDDVMHYQRILGYDKPFTFEKEDDNVNRKPVVKAANKS
ncbi:transmembrane protein 70 homolog, mitochondrial [Myzus persicae]|uniref:transmembrane protein 70 homolog, mitochondrial n=1 Tax=Myzus persicae TaxID=13164 RepID=UPI000B939C41|nr:transmembrane protein 70 homolog, mitochondrial [Myzus persicae]